MLRRTALGIALMSLLLVGAGLVACAESSDGDGLNPQPLPPGQERSDAPSKEAPPPTTTPGGGTEEPSAAGGDAGADASKGDGG